MFTDSAEAGENGGVKPGTIVLNGLALDNNPAFICGKKLMLLPYDDINDRGLSRLTTIYCSATSVPLSLGRWRWSRAAMCLMASSLSWWTVVCGLIMRVM